MALKKDIISTTGLEVKGAYIKIDEYSCDKSNQIRARVRAYISRDADLEGKSPIEGYCELTK